MAEYDDTNRGALFKNADKANEQQPDYTGSLNVGGKDFWLNAWLKTSKKGQKYMSVSVKPKTAKGQARPAADEDVPF